MKRIAKALVVARIKESSKQKPHGWDKQKAGPWDRKKIKKADGGGITWDDPPAAAAAPASNAIKWDDEAPSESKMPAEAPDHGLSERQKLSPVQKALSPITSYPETYSRMNKEAQGMMSEGAHQMFNPQESLIDPQAHGISEVLTGAGKTALGAAGYLTSPISAAYRSLLGQPVEDVTGIPREYTEFAAQLATPGIGLPKLPGATATVPSISATATKPASDVVAAADRASQVAPSPINVPRAFASDNIAVQRAGQLARNVPLVGDRIPQATGEMVDQMGNAVKSIASEYGEGSGPNVANRIGRTIGDAADAETASAQNAAGASDDAVLAAWQRSHENATAAVNNHEQNALTQARQATGNMSPQDMGQTLIQRLRTEEGAARARKDALYAQAGESDAAIKSDEVRNVRSYVAQGLEDKGVEIDPGSPAAPSITPASNRMMNVLQELSDLKIGNKAVGAATPADGSESIAAVSAKGLEQARKKLVFLRSGATNDADRRAATHIMHRFEDWQSDAYDNALFSGSPEALQVVRDARAANASWRQRFYNDRDDADKIINKIITGEVTPQEVSNWVVGASQVGGKGVSSRLLTRLAQATNNDPEAMNAIRGGIAHRLFGTTEGVEAGSPEKVANTINEFFTGSGRDVANRVYTPEQRQAALNYAATLRRSQEAKQDIAAVAKNTKPTPMQVGPGPMRDLATAVLGKSGKSDEALFSAIDAYAKSGGRADVQTLSDIVRNIPEKDRGDLAGAIIRKLGHSDQTNGFSPEKFATEWSKYTPQAKSVLFGNAGAHRQALDDIAMISQRYKEVGRRFGNPSGTAQNVAGLGALTGVVTHPYVAIPSLVGGAIFARLLSAPASAQKVAVFGKAASALAKGATPAKLAAVEVSAKGIAAAANRLGSHISSSQILRSLQGPVPAGAQDEQPKP